MEYFIERQEKAGLEIFVLRDSDGREVHVAPPAGFNAFAFRIPHRGETLQLLVEPKSDEQLRGAGFDFGTPILFPFQNRVKHGKYVFEGREYSLDPNFKDGNAIHGFACQKAWRVIESGADATRGAFVTAQFSTADDAEMQRQYPFVAHLTLTYSLRDGELHLAAHVENRGTNNLPMGFGIHPWFHAPLTAVGQRANCVLTLPARGYWELESQQQLIPTGRVLALDKNRDFNNGAALNQTFLDDVFTKLICEGDEHICTFDDRSSGLRLKMRSSCEAFREFVVYAPLDRDVICLEPYTSASDFINLEARGFDSGLIALSPGAQWEGHISFGAFEHS